MNTKKVIIGCCGCAVVLVLLGVVGFLGFGSFTLNGDCVFKGPLASVTEGPCLATQAGEDLPQDSGDQITSKDSIYTSSFGYAFDYPTGFTIEESGDELYIYPEKAPSALKFRDNMSIFFGDYSEMANDVIDQEFCESYAQSIFTSYSGEIIDTDVTVVRLSTGSPACQLWINADVQSYDITQFQYVVRGDANRYFVITVTTETGSSNLESMLDLVDSFDPSA